MKYRYAILLFLLAFLLQTTVLHHLALFGKTPNLLLCLVIMMPFFYEGSQGIVLGVLFGLLEDLCFSVLIGPTAIAFFLIALLMGEVRKRLYWDSILSIFITAVIGTSVYYSLLWGIVATFGGTYSIVYMLKGLPFLVVTNFIVMLVFYFTIGKRAIRHPQDKSMKGNLLHIE